MSGNSQRNYTPRSDAARGMAAGARERGFINEVPGFEIGGADRRAANAIVHAPPGEARNHVVAAAELRRKAGY